MPKARVTSHIVEVLTPFDGKGRVTQDVVEVLTVLPTISPTTITGAGVSQDVVEVLVLLTPSVKASHSVIEVLTLMDDPPGGGGASSHGFSS